MDLHKDPDHRIQDRIQLQYNTFEVNILAWTVHSTGAYNDLYKPDSGVTSDFPCYGALLFILMFCCA